MKIHECETEVSQYQKVIKMKLEAQEVPRLHLFAD